MTRRIKQYNMLSMALAQKKKKKKSANFRVSFSFTSQYRDIKETSSRQ